MELSPLVGEVEPAIAANVPECDAVVMLVDAPEVVQPLKLPVSKPPFVIPPGTIAVTVTLTVVLCVLLPSVPVTVTV
jgi:hypothetical protein